MKSEERLSLRINSKSAIDRNTLWFMFSSLSLSHTRCYTALPNQCRLLLFFFSFSYYPIVVVFSTVINCVASWLVSPPSPSSPLLSSPFSLGPALEYKRDGSRAPKKAMLALLAFSLSLLSSPSMPIHPLRVPKGASSIQFSITILPSLSLSSLVCLFP